MKKSLLFFVLFLGTTLIAQETTKINKYLSEIKQDGFIGVKKGDQWILNLGYGYWNEHPAGILLVTGSEKVGLIQEDGTWILDTLYVQIDPILSSNGSVEGLMVENTGGEFAYFSKSGQLIIPFEIQEFKWVSSYILSLQGASQVLYDSAGNIVVPRDKQEIEVTESGRETEIRIRKGDEVSVYITEKTPLPNGFTYVHSDFAVQKSVVSIYDYCLFLSSMKQSSESLSLFLFDSLPPIQSLIPDTKTMDAPLRTFWMDFQKKLSQTDVYSFVPLTNEPLNPTFEFCLPTKFTSLEKTMSAQPVTGITHENAAFYAAWLSQLFELYPFNSRSTRWKFSLPNEQQREIISKSASIEGSTEFNSHKGFRLVARSIDY